MDGNPKSKTITIGDKVCQIKVSKVYKTDLYKATLYKDGKLFDVTMVRSTTTEAAALGDQMVQRYQDALKNKDSFGCYISEHFIEE